MTDSVRAFYGELACDYPLLFAGWHAAVRRQAAVLDRIIPPLAAEANRHAL
jgi:hypothetical protein